MKTTNIGTVAATSSGGSGRLAQLSGQVAKILSDAITNASVLEVRTYTIRDVELGKDGEPGDDDTRLRALTRIALDGDTSVCLPLLADGELDEVVWRVHNEAVTQARADRAATMAMTIELLSKLSGR